MKIVLDKAAADALTAGTVAAFKQLGDVADKIGDAANEVTKAANATAMDHGGLRAWDAWSFASLLSRFTGR